jgi:hypothetical protein
VLAPDQWIDFIPRGSRIEIARVEGEGILLLLAPLLRCTTGSDSRGVGTVRRTLAGGVVTDLGDAVGNEIDHVQALDVLLREKMQRVAVLFSEQRDQHVGATDFLAPGGLHVEDGALQDPLEAQGRLRLAPVPRRNAGGVRIQPGFEFGADPFQIRTAGPEYGGRAGVGYQSQQEMLHGHEFVPLVAGILEDHVEAEFQFPVEHGGQASSIAQSSGC